MAYPSILSDLIAQRSLSETDATALMNEILEGNLSSEQIAGLLVAFRCKGESLEEIVGFVKAMREHAVKLPTELPVVDTCGTGGDKSGTFNISTTAALIAAGAGVYVGKHHNRSVSSACGSADVLEKLGIENTVSYEKVLKGLETVGIGFCFAPMYHKSLKYAVIPRKELGIRTVFNMLGPLLNPFSAKRQVIGVFDGGLTKDFASILKTLGSTHVFILHGKDGLDEFTLCSETIVSELKNGSIDTYEVSPEDLGLKRAKIEDLMGKDAAHNANLIKNILAGETGPKRDIVVANAAFAIVASGKAQTLQEGVEMANMALDSKAALNKLNELKTYYSK